MQTDTWIEYSGMGYFTPPKSDVILKCLVCAILRPEQPLPSDHGAETPSGFQLSVQPPPCEAEQALRQENDHRDENESERDQIRELVAEHA